MTFEESERQAELEALAAQLHDQCRHREACDRAAEMHTVEQTHDWLRCEECNAYERERAWE